MSVTLDDARRIAEKLKNSPHVRAVELFGSTLRNGIGRDADFVILTSDEIASAWWQSQAELIRVRWPHDFYGQRWIVKKFLPFFYGATTRRRRSDRLVVAAKLLGIDLADFKDQARNPYDFELFLFPEHWRAEGMLNAGAFKTITPLIDHRNTRGFLERIAKEAMRI